MNDVVRVMTICYALIAVGFNLRNVQSIHAAGGTPILLINAIRLAVVVSLFVGIGIAEVAFIFGEPLTWRSPALFVCCTVYLWSQIEVHIQLMVEKSRREYRTEEKT